MIPPVISTAFPAAGTGHGHGERKRERDAALLPATGAKGAMPTR